MTKPIDFEALRARRAADILNVSCAADDGPEWLQNWGGVHTLDDGHPGSYDHEAVASTDSVTVTLTCQCSAWASSALADTDDAPADLFGRWEAHVYTATGRWQADGPVNGGSAISGRFPDDEVAERLAGWTPSPGLFDGLRADLDALDALDAQVAAMRTIPALGDPSDEAWSAAVEALQANNDSIRRPLDAEDWPGLALALRSSRARLAEAERLVCASLDLAVTYTEADNAARGAMVGGAAR